MERWRTWTPDTSRRRIAHPALGEVLAWHDVEHDPASGIVTYGTYYEVLAQGRTLRTSAKLAFPSREQLAPMLREAGLVVEKWLGDWSGSPFILASPEIIPLGRAAAVA